MAFLETPVLFLIFNRPEETSVVFEQIRKAKPSQLFIAADGARLNKPEEKEVCELTRKIVLDGIDWNCEVHTLFRDKNLGCGQAVSQAITWFFSQAEEGIILEDDCLPDQSFFQFCSELLKKYKTDQRVMSISGSNLINQPWKINRHSYFWGPGGIWGWATWRRAWKLYDIKMDGWRDDEIKARFRDAIGTADLFAYYCPMIDAAFNGTLDTWDVQWMYSVLINGGLFINPAVNLVQNIGFTGNATHTNYLPENNIAALSANKISFPLVHPVHKVKDVEYLKLFFATIKHKDPPKVVLLKRIVKHFLRKASL